MSREVAEADSAFAVQSQADGEGGKEAGAAFVADGVGCAPAPSADVGGFSVWPPLLAHNAQLVPWDMLHCIRHHVHSPRRVTWAMLVAHALTSHTFVFPPGYGYGYMVPNSGQAAVPVGMFQPPQQFPAMGMVPAMMAAGDDPQVRALLFSCISPCDCLLTF